jgi:hypothetical protein
MLRLLEDNGTPTEWELMLRREMKLKAVGCRKKVFAGLTLTPTTGKKSVIEAFSYQAYQFRLNSTSALGQRYRMQAQKGKGRPSRGRQAQTLAAPGPCRQAQKSPKTSRPGEGGLRETSTLPTSGIISSTAQPKESSRRPSGHSPSKSKDPVDCALRVAATAAHSVGQFIRARVLVQPRRFLTNRKVWLHGRRDL